MWGCELKKTRSNLFNLECRILRAAFNDTIRRLYLFRISIFHPLHNVVMPKYTLNLFLIEHN